MPDALSEARWAGIRAICEGQPPTQERVARATGVYVKTIARRAGQEKWKTLDFRRKRVRAAWLQMIDLAGFARDGEELDPVPAQEDDWPREAADAAPEPWPDESPAARIARIGAVLTRRIEVMLQRVEAGHPLESRQVAALSSLVTLSERIAALAQEEAKKERKVTEEEVAQALAKIDRRIFELAIEFARIRVAWLLVHRFGIPFEEVEARLAEEEPPEQAHAWLTGESPAEGR